MPCEMFVWTGGAHPKFVDGEVFPGQCHPIGAYATPQEMQAYYASGERNNIPAAFDDISPELYAKLAENLKKCHFWTNTPVRKIRVQPRIGRGERVYVKSDFRIRDQVSMWQRTRATHETLGVDAQWGDWSLRHGAIAIFEDIDWSPLVSEGERYRVDLDSLTGGSDTPSEWRDTLLRVPVFRAETPWTEQDLILIP